MSTENLIADDFKGKSLFVAIPCYGGQMCAETAARLFDLNTMCTYFGIKIQVKLIQNESLVVRARNYLTHYFEVSDFSHMMFIDADIVFDPRDVLHLLKISDDEHEVIGGLYPKKHIVWERIRQVTQNTEFVDALTNINYLAEFGGDFAFNPKERGSIDITKPVEVAELATGFMMIQRSALEKFKAAHPEYMYTPDHRSDPTFNGNIQICQYFHSEINPKSNRYESEDYWFCNKLREIDVKIFATPWMTLHHIGTFAYKGSVSAMAMYEGFKQQALDKK